MLIVLWIVSACSRYSNGIFILSELEAFPALLHRLGRVHSLFTLPHPLIKTADNVTQYKDEHYTDSITGDLISMEGFHKMFLNYCIEQRFFSLMSHYLDLYGYVPLLFIHIYYIQ